MSITGLLLVHPPAKVSAFHAKVGANRLYLPALDIQVRCTELNRMIRHKSWCWLLRYEVNVSLLHSKINNLAKQLPNSTFMITSWHSNTFLITGAFVGTHLSPVGSPHTRQWYRFFRIYSLSVRAIFSTKSQVFGDLWHLKVTTLIINVCPLAGLIFSLPLPTYH